MAVGATLPARLKAAGIHLSISAVLFVILLYFIVFHWYPAPYFWLDGGWQGVQIAASVDLVLGPFLTLVIFNPLKPRRKIAVDLGMIATIQALALAAGVYAIHGQRPVAVVYWQGVFHSVQPKAFEAQPGAWETLPRLSSSVPPLIHAVPPATTEEFAQMLLLALNQHLAEYEQVGRYQSLTSRWGEVAARGLDAARLAQDDPVLAKDLAAFAQARAGNAGEALIYLPFKGRYGNALLVFDTKGVLLGALRRAQAPPG